MITKKFGERIRELRTKNHMSQEKFALHIGMDRTYLASVEIRTTLKITICGVIQMMLVTCSISLKTICCPICFDDYIMLISNELCVKGKGFFVSIIPEKV